MSLNIISPFGTAFNIYKERELTKEEEQKAINDGSFELFMTKKIGIDKIIKSPMDAAEFVGADQHENRLNNYVDNFLTKNTEYARWLSFMPQPTPSEMIKYQQSYLQCNPLVVNDIVIESGIYLPINQTLFRGGMWPKDDNGNNLLEYTTEKILSTSFCPLVALNNADWMGKSWDNERLDLIVITNKSTNTKSFVFDKDAESGHELEVLLAAGAQLKFIEERIVTNTREVYKSNNVYECIPKTIPVFIISAIIV